MMKKPYEGNGFLKKTMYKKEIKVLMRFLMAKAHEKKISQLRNNDHTLILQLCFKK